MYKKIYIIIAFVFGISSLYAQNQVDALRYSQQFYTGNAKFMSMGNSLSVVGADMSALSINPAGIAVFKSSKIEFSPMVLINNTEATFIERTYDQSVNNIGNSTSEYKVGLGLSNFGMVGVVTNENGAWKQISIGFSYNKMNDYRQELVVSGENNNSSYLDYLVYNANSPYGDKYGDRYSKFREQLAEYSSLLLFDDSNNEYYSHIADAAQYGQTQRKTISRTGHGNEYDITIGANYRNFLYLGGSIGIENVKFEQNVKYSEEDYIDVEVENPIGSGNYVQVDPNIMEYTEFLSTKGYGINFKLGLIFQPVKFIRIGGAVHSSTFYSLTDEYKTSMYADFPTADSNGDYADTEYNLFDYRLKTPLRANAGIAFILEPYKI
ncbi:MAG: hypothetical protein GY756_25890, partial [bacterium]|nr:hypothetical protein [bacterium]